MISSMQLGDNDLLAVFYYCDQAVNQQMEQLNYLMRTSPDNLGRRSVLIRQLKEAQHNLMNIILCIVQQAIPADQVASRDYRVKYPDDVLLDQINGKCSHIVHYYLQTSRAIVLLSAFVDCCTSPILEDEVACMVITICFHPCPHLAARFHVKSTCQNRLLPKTLANGIDLFKSVYSYCSNRHGWGGFLGAYPEDFRGH